MSGWQRLLPDPDTGVWIFGVGLAALVLSIGGLVTVGIRRRQW